MAARLKARCGATYNALGPAVGRNGGCESLTVRLTNPACWRASTRTCAPIRRCRCRPTRKGLYYENQAGGVATALKILAGFVGIVMGIGAVFGAMNTMYAIVSQRTREIGTLRALGFSRFSILLSFVMESVLLALVGGLLGCLIAIPMNGFTAGTGQTQSFSELAFAFKITPGIVHRGTDLRGADGLCGRTAAGGAGSQMPITKALREA